MSNPSAIAVRSSLAILCVIFLHAARLAHADLYTDGVLSIEWLVASSDDIYLVEIGPPPVGGQPTLKSFRVLKEYKDGAHLNEDQIAKEIVRFRPIPESRPQEDEDWLLFVRGMHIRGHVVSRHVFRRIDLTNPLESYHTAAVTREGKPLADRQAILDFVEARLQLNRQLPRRVDRRAVDRLAGSQSRRWKPKDELDMEMAYLKTHIGGTLVPISCFYWDEAGPNDVDTLLNRAVVPIEPEDHARLLEAAQQDPDSPGRSEFCHPVMALVNFPGDETEACLKKIIASARGGERGHAHSVLRFFAYHLEPTDPKNKELVGQWRLEGRNERIELTFTRDQTFVATAFSRPRHEYEKSRHLWDGQGYWSVRDGKLSIMRTHSRRGLAWCKNSREFFREKKIDQITPIAVMLEDGPPMTRK